MAMDGIFIYKLTKELKEKLIGGRIDKVYQPEKDEMTLFVNNNKRNYIVEISADSNLPHITLTDTKKENPDQPPMFCMLMRKNLIGARIKDITQRGLERVIEISMDVRNELGDIVDRTLVIEIMGKHSNVILLNESSVIIDGIKRIPLSVSRVRQILPGLNFEYLSSHKMNILDVDSTSIKEHLLNGSEMPIFKAIYMHFEGFSPLVAKNICNQCNIDFNLKTQLLNDTELSGIATSLEKLANEIKEDKFSGNIYTDNTTDKAIDFHILDIIEYQDPKYGVEIVDSPTMIINLFYLKKDRQNRISQKSSNLRKSVSQRLDRAKNKHSKLVNEQIQAENADIYKIYGELILANIYQIEKGMNEVAVINYYDENQSEIVIKLDVRLTASENSQKYYKKYNKLRNAQVEISKQIEETDEEIKYLDQVLTNIDNSTDQANLEEIRSELAEVGYLKKKFIKKQKKAQKISYLEYTSTDGFTILVGRNNKENDHLTLKLASNKDIWLHTKIIPGSHVIIRTLGEDVPEKTILEAASIAAFHSKAKLSSQVPVDYTIVKNVTKPNGAKPGMVIYSTNSTIYVTPNEDEIMKLKKTN